MLNFSILPFHSLNWGLSKHQKISSTPVRKVFFFLHGDFTPFMSKSAQIWDHFFPLLFPKDSENPKSLDIGLWEVGAKRYLNGMNKFLKICKKKIPPRRFYTLYEQTFSNLRPLLSNTFPQGFQKSKSFGHWTSGSGGKIPLNSVLFHSNSG